MNDYLSPSDIEIAKAVYGRLVDPQFKIRNQHGEGHPICVEWDILTEYEDGTSHRSHGQNLVVNAGRTQMFNLGFIPSGSANGGFYYLGVGASATAATVSDTRLTYELIGNATRKTLTDTSGGTPVNGDITNNVVTVSGCTFQQQLILQAIFLTTDGNNGNTFNEYGLFTSATLPGSPTGTSGTMFNHYIDPSPAAKAATNQVTAQVTIRF